MEADPGLDHGPPGESAVDVSGRWKRESPANSQLSGTLWEGGTPARAGVRVSGDVCSWPILRLHGRPLPPVLRNYSITPTRAPADVRDASRPAPIRRAPRGARRSDGALVVSRRARRGRPRRRVTEGRFEPARSRRDHAAIMPQLGDGPAKGSVCPRSNFCGAQGQVGWAGRPAAVPESRLVTSPLGRADDRTHSGGTL